MSRILSRVPLTVPHVYDFGSDRERIGADLLNAQSWDVARAYAAGFQLPTTREEWERQADRPEFAARAEAILRLATSVGARVIASYGVGGASLERHIALQAPEATLICSDFAPGATNRLTKLFPEADVRLLDFRRDHPVQADLHLMHRIDTELSNDDWRDVFARFSSERVLFVPGELVLTWNALRAKLRAQRSGRYHATQAGWARTEAAVRSLWRATHTDEPWAVADLQGFFLTPKGH